MVWVIIMDKKSNYLIKLMASFLIDYYVAKNIFKHFFVAIIKFFSEWRNIWFYEKVKMQSFIT